MRYIIGLAARAGLACIPASITDRKGYSYALFWCLSFFLSFLIILIVAACLPDRSDRCCGTCGAYIRENEAFCRQCGAYFHKNYTICRRCGAKIYEEEAFCKKCGANQTAAVAVSPAPVPISADNSDQDLKSYSVRNMPVSSLGFISCPGCGERQRADRNECCNCGARFIH